MTDYTTNPDYRAMLAGIRADTADDLKRLVLADWLDEHGQAERAELIRVQCRIAEMTRAPDEAARVQQHLKQKQAELIALHGHQWAIRGVINSPAGVVWINGEERETETRPVCEWSRGFLHTVRGPLAHLIGGECGRCAPRRRMAAEVERLESALGVATDLLALHDTCSQCHGTGRTVGVLPTLVREGVIERVEVVDRDPLSVSGASFCWQNKDHPHQNYHDDLGCYMLPGFVIDLMPTGWSDNVYLRWFTTREDAVSALSAAMIRWAESEGEK